jgi:hypothetical protein
MASSIGLLPGGLTDSVRLSLEDHPAEPLPAPRLRQTTRLPHLSRDFPLFHLRGAFPGQARFEIDHFPEPYRFTVPTHFLQASPACPFNVVEPIAR